jgi:hypothetical protein
MERDYGEGAWRDSMERERGTSYSIWPSPTAVTYVTLMSHSDLQLDLAFFYVESYKIRNRTYALHTVFHADTVWSAFYLSKVTKSESTHLHTPTHTLQIPEREPRPMCSPTLT